jgi:hypothetical protein
MSKFGWTIAAVNLHDPAARTPPPPGFITETNVGISAHRAVIGFIEPVEAQDR